VIYQQSLPAAGHPRGVYSVIYNNIALPEQVIPTGGVVYASSNGSGLGCGTDCGVIFSLTPPASGAGEWTKTVLYSFAKGVNGYSPGPLAMDAAGALYGAASSGGTGCPKYGGCGTVFKLAPPAARGKPWNFTVLYRFAGGTAGQQPLDGVILDGQGNLYGVAQVEFPSAKFLVFKLTPPSGGGQWTESVLYRFYAPSQCYFGGPLAIDANGALYGAFSGGSSVSSCDQAANEYAYQLTPSKADPKVWVRTVMHTFTLNNLPGGDDLNAPLTVDSAGNVYGTTYWGGQNGNPGGAAGYGGTAFVLQPRPGSPGKWNYKVLFDFDPLPTSYHHGNTTGSSPNGGLVLDSAGAIYGTTLRGGTGDRGALFSLAP
jgi:hypothetical protein